MINTIDQGRRPGVDLGLDAVSGKRRLKGKNYAAFLVSQKTRAYSKATRTGCRCVDRRYLLTSMGLRTLTSVGEFGQSCGLSAD